MVNSARPGSPFASNKTLPIGVPTTRWWVSSSTTDARDPSELATARSSASVAAAAVVTNTEMSSSGLPVKTRRRNRRPAGERPAAVAPAPLMYMP